MERSPIVPCVWLDDQAEEAARFYAAAFRDARVVAVTHYPETLDTPGGKPRGSVLTVELELMGQRFTLLNGGAQFTLNPSVSFFVFVDAPDEASRLFAALVEGGDALMPLDRYPWSERYGWARDRYGVTWQVLTGARPAPDAAIVPCLMFHGAQRGRAAEAMSHYVAAFPDSRVDGVERYGDDEPGAGMVKHGRFTLGGSAMVAMDSPIDHAFSFNEALSLQAMCVDQREVDGLWAALTEGGEPGPCGWLRDRFGVSWQVVPARIADWMTSKDAPARDRAFAALLSMTKLDIAALEAAFHDS